MPLLCEHLNNIGGEFTLDQTDLRFSLVRRMASGV